MKSGEKFDFNTWGLCGVEDCNSKNSVVDFFIYIQNRNISYLKASPHT